MAIWEKNILGLVSQDEWLNIGLDVTRPNDPIDGLFGDEKTNNLFARWQSIASEYQLPVMAQFHSFDTEAQQTIRVPVDNHNIEKGLIKVKMNLSERMRALLNSGVRDSELYDYVLDDGARLAEQVETRTKIAKNELLASGKITIKENNLDLTVNYGVPADQVAYELDLDTAADLPGQIQAIIDDADKKGVTLTGFVTSRQNLTKMRQNDLMQTFVNGAMGSGAILRNAEFRDFLESEYGLSSIITNDLTYNLPLTIGEDGRPVATAKRYFPADKVTFFAANSSGRLGTGLWGNPPEADPQVLEKAAASGRDPYIFIDQWEEKDPKVLWTKASGLFMPVLYNPNSLFIATVKAGE